MSQERIAPEEIASFAAEGVALALRAREELWRGPIHIICGIPAVLYDVTVERAEQGGVTIDVRESSVAAR